MTEWNLNLWDRGRKGSRLLLLIWIKGLKMGDWLFYTEEIQQSLPKFGSKIWVQTGTLSQIPSLITSDLWLCILGFLIGNMLLQQQVFLLLRSNGSDFCPLNDLLSIWSIESPKNKCPKLKMKELLGQHLLKKT